MSNITNEGASSKWLRKQVEESEKKGFWCLPENMSKEQAYDILRELDVLRKELKVAYNNADIANTELRRISMVLNHELATTSVDSISEMVSSIKAELISTKKQIRIMQALSGERVEYVQTFTTSGTDENQV